MTGNQHRETRAFVEPGHHYEWVWLLNAYDKTIETEPTGHGAALFEFAIKHGTSPDDGLTIDEVLERWISKETNQALLAANREVEG